MMITIHGFPPNTKYQDVKILIKQMSKIVDYMLGDLMIDKDGSKKVRIGLSDDNEGYTLLKCLNGYRMGAKYVLRAFPVGKSAVNPPPQNNFDSRPNYPGNQEFNDYQPRGNYQGGGDHPNPPSSFGNRPLQGPSGMSGPSPQGVMNSGRQGQWSQNNSNTGPWGSNQALGPQGSQNNYNYQQQQNAPPYGQQQPSHSQRPDGRFGQGRPQDQSFGYPPKNNIPNQNQGPPRPMDGRQLRSIETVDTVNPPVHGRYQPTPQFQDKPVTIMKDNFQGPTQFNINHPGDQGQHYQEPGQQNWQHHGKQSKPFNKLAAGPYDKPSFEDRKYPPTNPREVTKNLPLRPETYKDFEKSGRGLSPNRSSHIIRGSAMESRDPPLGRRISPGPGRHISPPGRHISPPGRRISPSGRGISPGRMVVPPFRRSSPPLRGISPPGRRSSPPAVRVSEHARRYSPSDRRVSPSDRHMSGRRPSPHKRVSPAHRTSPGRRPSPGRRDSPNRSSRYSPGRHHPDKSSDKFVHDPKGLKQVRPGYEPPSQAQNQAMYSGGFRQSAHENVQYPVAGARLDPQRSPWQRDRDDYVKKQDDDRRGTRMDIPRERVPEKIIEPARPAIRKSRSPVRRDRSPIKDRFKRHSPSPRSPRRSWALEKRRSPDLNEAPPPPSWPGQSREENPIPDYQHRRPNFSARDQMDTSQSRPTFSKPEVPHGRPFKADMPDRPTFTKTEVPHFRPTFTETKEAPKPKWERPIDEERSRRPDDDDRRFKKAPRDEPLGSQGDRYPPRELREPKFSPRDDYDVGRRGVDYRRPDEPPSKVYSHRGDDGRRPRDDDRHHVEERRPRDDSPRREVREKLLKKHSIDEDFEDNYNRALQFKKKAEELRRSANRRGESEEGRSHHADMEKSRFEGRRYEDEEQPRSRDEDRSRQIRGDYRRDEENQREQRTEEARKKVNNPAREKREKAVGEISSKIMERHKDFSQLQGEQRQRVFTELNYAVSRIVYNMFGDEDVAFIEIVVKYQAKYSMKDEEKILQDVLASLPPQFRTIKRRAPEASEIPAKTSRRSASPGLRPESSRVSKFSEPKSRRHPLNTMKPKPQRVEYRRTIEMRKQIPAKLARGTTKPVQKATSSEVKANVSASEVKKPLPLPVEPAADGYYELNPLMTRMVETELQNIMIKVWQELPDDPVDVADELVVDKLRNKAGDDLRNVLGLNITKRLLNIHNPLYVKIQFSGKPEKVYLSAFLKRYNFNAFKRIENSVNTFAAQVRTIADFDRICSAKDIRCGSDVKVTVTPCYRFTKSPANLRTAFNDTEEASDSSEKDIDMKDANNIEDNVDKTLNATSITPTKESLVEQTNSVVKDIEPKVSEVKTSKPLESIKAEPKTEVPKVSKVVQTPVKENKKIENEKTLSNVKLTAPAANKSAATKTVVNRPEETKKIENKPNIAAQNVNTARNDKATPNTNKTNVPTKQIKNETIVAKKVEPTKAPAQDKPVAKKIEPPKVPTQDKKIANKIEPSKVTTQNTKTIKTPVKVNNKPINTVKNVVSKPVLKPKQNLIKKVDKVENDFDELDDHDILALMSEGIVLDECTGSDDE